MKILFLYLISALTLPSTLLAETTSGTKNILIYENIRVCKSQTTAFLMALPTEGEWITLAPAASGQRARIASKKFGTWYELNTATDGKAMVTETSNLKSIRHSFTRDCKVEIQTTPGFEIGKAQSEHGELLSDEDLRKILTSNESGLIYVWSPGMVYSASYFNQYKEVAKLMKLKFVPVVDASATRKSVGEAKKSFGIEIPGPSLNSVELFMRGMTVHYPSAILFNKNKLIDPFIVGVFTDKELQTEIKKKLRSVGE